jgi:hypothetical protein
MLSAPAEALAVTSKDANAPKAHLRSIALPSLFAHFGSFRDGSTEGVLKFG